MTILEKELEKKLKDKVKQHGGLCLKWVCPGWSGVPDRLVLLPGGRIIFVEMKRPKGSKLSALQRWWFVKLHRLGFKVWQIWTEQDLFSFELKELREVVT
jgi:hypothetical protein